MKPGFANKPVTFVSFYDALRFANWLHNGQGTGDTETGAYTITLAGISDNSITRNAGATVFLTSGNEWYKAAFYDPMTATYFNYPAGYDTDIVCAPPGAVPNTANCDGQAYFSTGSALTDVGSYTGSASPNGTFDQAGNVWEWNESFRPDDFSNYVYRTQRGGAWDDGYVTGSVFFYGRATPTGLNYDLGFRVAMIPEPSTGLLVMTGLLGLAYRQRRHGRAA